MVGTLHGRLSFYAVFLLLEKLLEEGAAPSPIFSHRRAVKKSFTDLFYRLAMPEISSVKS